MVKSKRACHLKDSSLSWVVLVKRTARALPEAIIASMIRMIRPSVRVPCIKSGSTSLRMIVSPESFESATILISAEERFSMAAHCLKF